MLPRKFNFLIYKSEDEEVSISPIIKGESIWLTQKLMAELFGVNVPAISKHLKNIFEEGELDQNVVVSKMEITKGTISKMEIVTDNKVVSLRGIQQIQFLISPESIIHLADPKIHWISVMMICHFNV